MFRVSDGPDLTVSLFHNSIILSLRCSAVPSFTVFSISGTVKHLWRSFLCKQLTIFNPSSANPTKWSNTLKQTIKSNYFQSLFSQKPLCGISNAPLILLQEQRSQINYKMLVLNNCSKFTGKTTAIEPFLVKLKTIPTTLPKSIKPLVFPDDFWETFQSSLLTEISV